MTPFVEAARQLVRGLFWADQPIAVLHDGKQLTWRHHGLGMLQAEISETLRIHIWHPKLVSEGMAWPRCVHDHRFDITSAVIVGEVIDVPCEVMQLDTRTYCRLCNIHPDEPETIGVTCPQHVWVTPVVPDAPNVNVYEIEHAKNQDRMVDQKGCSTATQAKLLARGALRAREANPQRAGEEYHIPRRVFHTTRVSDLNGGLAITVIHRSNFDNHLARVLCAPDKDVTAISGIVRDDSIEHRVLMAHVLREASDAIANMGRAQ
jgi:hypothetical protein